MFQVLKFWSTVYTMVASMLSSRAISAPLALACFGPDLGREVQAFHSFYRDIINRKLDQRGCGI